MESFARLTSVLRRLPGIGRRSAERIATKLVRDSEGVLADLLRALEEVRRNLCCCVRCGSITSVKENPCSLCTSAERDGKTLCVVEDPNDIQIIERSGGFRGRYHALMGKLSPMRGEGLEDLRLGSLLKRIENEKFEEVILAFSTDVEGDATASYIVEALKDRRIKVTRLAFGLPVGSGLIYADPETVAKAIKGRQDA